MLGSTQYRCVRADHRWREGSGLLRGRSRTAIREGRRLRAGARREWNHGPGREDGKRLRSGAVHDSRLAGHEIENVVRGLQAKGVHFEIFGFFKQDELGIWTAPTGDKVAWFKDPDGNILSVSQHV